MASSSRITHSYSINVDAADENSGATDENKNSELTHLIRRDGGRNSKGSRCACTKGCFLDGCCGILAQCRVQRRLPTGRSLMVVLVLNVLESFVFFQGLSGMFAQVFQDDLKSIEALVPLLFQIITNSAGRLVYPFAGFLADAYLTRGRVIYLSMWLLWVSLSVMSIGLTVRAKIDMPVFYVLQVTTYVIFCIGIGSFEANVIPFGADQLQGVSSEEASAYFYWYYWTRQLGNLLGIISIFAVQFVTSQLKESMEPVIGSVAITLGIVTYMIYSKSLLSAGPPSNPLKLVASVTFYAATLKRGSPQYRRAFRYGEGKKGRMDLAKKDFDGKFESEEVEDVKTFYRILMMFLPMGIFYIVYYGVCHRMLYVVMHDTL